MTKKKSKTVISQHGILQEKNIIFYFEEIAKGLHYLHTNRLNHGNISTSNVFSVKSQNKYVAELGIFRHVYIEIPKSHFCTHFSVCSIKTDPQYYTNEWLQGFSYMSSDVFALGILFLTGNHQFSKILLG